MFWQRVATALIGAPLVLALFWFGPDWAVTAFVAVIILLSGIEWTRLSRFSSAAQSVGFCAVLAGAMLLTAFAAKADAAALLGDVNTVALWLAVPFWLGMALWLRRYPSGFRAGRVHPAWAAMLGLLILVPAFVAVAWLHRRADGGSPIVLTLLMMVWAADVGGYVAGHALGRHKLSPVISPGKTIEGALGGVALGAGITALLGWALLGYSGRALGWLTVVAACVTVFSIVGDLSISMFKRQAKIKDTGAILPGHGGLLDRLDSLFAAAPLLALGLMHVAPLPG